MAILGSTNLTGCNSIPDFIPTGTRMIFEQSTIAPLSWTKLTTHNNKALRVVAGTATPGGSTEFSSVFGSRPVTGSISVSVSGGSVGNTTLSTPQIPNHTHPNGTAGTQGVTEDFAPRGEFPLANRTVATFGTTGGVNGPSGGAHSHPFSVGSASGSFSGNALDFAVAYVDVIIAAKN